MQGNVISRQIVADDVFFFSAFAVTFLFQFHFLKHCYLSMQEFFMEVLLKIR